MGIFDDGFVFNHVKKQAFYYYRGENRLPEVERLLKQPLESETFSFTQPKVNIKKETYEAAVEKAKKYITAGDIFQVVLIQTLPIPNIGQFNPVLSGSANH